MSAPEPTPFAVVDYAHGEWKLRACGQLIAVTNGVHRGEDFKELAIRIDAAINAAVQRERQAAAALALREAAEVFDDHETFPPDVRDWLRSRAERAEKGEG